MIESKKNDIIATILVSFLIMCFYLFELETWGRYVLIAITVVITILYCVRHHFKLFFSFGAFHYQILMFAIYCFVSAIWAWNTAVSISKGLTITSILLCFSFIYCYFDECDSVEPLVNAILFAGYGIALYAISFYGISEIMMVARGATRLGNDFTNINSIGMVAAISCLIQYYYFKKGKYRRLVFLALPALIMIAASQSRKAIVMLIVGIFLITAITSEKEKRRKSILRVLLAVFVLALLIWALNNLSILSGSNLRMQQMLSSFGNDAQETGRQYFRRVGLEQFKKTPILGIGIGNSAELLDNLIGRRTYLHDNYIELLSCGGIVGFAIYYSIYAYLIVNLWKYRICDNGECYLCLVLIILMLVMDYGMVSYFDKQQYIYFMLCYLQIEKCKRRAGV